MYDIFEELSRIGKKEEIELQIKKYLELEKAAFDAEEYELFATFKLARTFFVGAYVALTDIDPVKLYEKVLQQDLDRIFSEKDDKEPEL